MNNENRTDKMKKKKKRRKKRYLLKFILLVIICVGIYFALHIDFFSVDGIAVIGNKEISDDEIIKQSELETGTNIFDVHPWLVERKIKKNLYVESVDVSRKLPDKIEIHVVERGGKAQFVMGKKYVITDNSGMVIEVAGEMKKIPIVENVTVEEAETGEDIAVKEKEVLRKALKLIKATEDNDLYFKKVKINGNSVEAYIYDSLVCRGDYDNVMDSIESGAVRAVVYDLYQKGVESGIINVSSNNYCSFTP